MTTTRSVVKGALIKGSFLVSLLALASGCVVAPREGYHEGYWDHEHNRWYHEHGWVDCGEHDVHCR
jgi:hypothetical protein